MSKTLRFILSLWGWRTTSYKQYRSMPKSFRNKHDEAIVLLQKRP